MEQSKQTEDTTTATLICAFVMSGKTSDSQSQVLSGPNCVLLILGQKACEARQVSGKITSGGLLRQAI